MRTRTYRRGPAVREVFGRGGREGEGRGVGQGFRGEEPHCHRHISGHAPLTPRPVTHGEVQLVPEGEEEMRRKGRDREGREWRLEKMGKREK